MFLRDEKDGSIEGGEEYGYALAADTSVEMEELNRLKKLFVPFRTKCGQVYRKSREEGKTNQEIAGKWGFHQDSGGPNNQSLEAYQEIFRRTVYLLF